MSIAHILGCASATNVRPRDDFFRTRDHRATAALIAHEGDRIPRKVWEPFVGKDDIGIPLEKSGREVVKTDLNDRGVGESRVDFLMERKARATAIVSNPPFCLARQIVAHAHWPLKIEYMALLLKPDFFNSGDGMKSFEAWEPSRIRALSWRPDFTGQGRPCMTMSWYVWDRSGQTCVYDVIGRAA